MRVALRGFVVLVGFALGGASLGLAQGPLRIRYTGFEGCPDEGAFVRDVTSRIHADGDDPRSFAVVVERRGARVVGRIDGSDRNGRAFRRELRGESCAEVASALALVVALAIDPRASLAPIVAATAPVASSAPPRAPEPPASASAPPPVVSVAPTLPPRAPVENHSDSDSQGVAIAWSAGADAVVVTPVAPSAAFGAAAFVELARDVDGPSARLIALYAGRNIDLAGGAGARFRYLAGRLEGCPVRFPVGRQITLAPCGGVDLGAIRGEGVNLPETRTASRFFGAALALARAAWAIAPPVSIEGALGAMAPLVRDDFVVDGPRTQVHTPPYVGAIFAIGAAARFW